MKKFVFASVLALVSSFSTFASAADTKFSCSNVADVAEWTIYVDLDKNLAGFFDNDATVVIPLDKVRSAETNPPQMIYTFEGKDGDSDSVIRISFNATKLSASITFDVDGNDERTEESLDGCEVEPDLDLEEGN